MRRLAAVTAIAGLLSACAYPGKSSHTLHTLAYFPDAILVSAITVEFANVGSGPDAEVSVGTWPLVCAGIGLLGLVINGGVADLPVSKPTRVREPEPPPAPPTLDDLAARATASAHARLCDDTREVMRVISERDRARFDEIVRDERAVAVCLLSL